MLAGRRPRIRRPVTATRSPSCCWPTSTAWARTATSCSGSTASGGRSRALTLEGQLALDDLQYENTGGDDPLSQPLGLHRWRRSARSAAALGWRAFYTQASSLAFRTLRSVRELHRRRRGTRPQLRRHGPALRHGQRAGAATRWLLTPELTAAAPGRGRDQRPLPRHPGGGRRRSRSSSSAWWSAPGGRRWA